MRRPSSAREVPMSVPMRMPFPVPMTWFAWFPRSIQPVPVAWRIVANPIPVVLDSDVSDVRHQAHGHRSFADNYGAARAGKALATSFGDIEPPNLPTDLHAQNLASLFAGSDGRCRRAVRGRHVEARVGAAPWRHGVVRFGVDHFK